MYGKRRDEGKGTVAGTVAGWSRGRSRSGSPPAAGRAALDRAGIDPQPVGALYIGSESHPYAVEPSGTVVVEALGIGPRVHVADFEFACKAGTEAMFVALILVESGRVEYAMGIGAEDTPDFWRREGEFYPRHGGGFTGEPAYFKHVLAASRGILETPYAVAIVETPEGARLMVQLVDCEPEAVKPGLPVALEFRLIRQEGHGGILCYGHKAVPAGA